MQQGNRSPNILILEHPGGNNFDCNWHRHARAHFVEVYDETTLLQIAGKPNFSSDLYSLGVTTIEALTGLIPRQFQHDATGEIAWTHRADLISEALQDFLRCMVAMDSSERYDSATAALEALKQVPEIALLSEERPQIQTSPTERMLKSFDNETEDAFADTQIWLQND